MENVQEFDVVICGAGPAGTTCALALFDAGLKVALLDKETFPREKVCGDGYASYCYKVLNTISPKFGKQLQEFTKGLPAKKIKVISPKGFQVVVDFPDPYFLLPRKELDYFLLQMVQRETDTQFFENCSIKSVSKNTDGVVLETSLGTFKGKVVVGCDGAQSLVRSVITKTREITTESSPAMRAYYKGVKNLDPNCIEVYLSKSMGPGYFWVFPSPGNLANVGIGIDKSYLTANKMQLKKEFYNMLETNQFLKANFETAEVVDDLKGWTIPAGYTDGKYTLSTDRVLLCGDAAALADPSTGEGIGPAISSGRFAGKYIKECFQANDFSASFMLGYDRIIKKKYYADYKKRNFTVSIFCSYPILFDICIGFFGKSKRIMKACVKIMQWIYR